MRLLDEFKRMVNVCISIGIEENVSSLKTLSLKSYHLLSRDILSYYRLGAISTATSILRNYRKAKRKNPRTEFPYAKKLMLTSCYGFKIEGDLLRLPIKPRQYVHIKLNHTQRTLSGLNVRSVTLTPGSISINYSKEIVQIEPEGYLGVDRNLDNVTTVSTQGTAQRFDLSKATRIKSTYRFVKSRFKRNDARIRGRVFSKYGEKQRNRVQPLLHNVSKRIVDEAKTRRHGIVMERLTGIRGLYRKGNFQGRNYRARMNSWSYGELQRQVEYKARWAGVKVIYVPARNTSKRCSICGYKTLESTQRQLWCPKCNTILDRDENAARNIAAGGLRFSPNGPPGEAMVEEREPENATLILKVDGGKLSQRSTKGSIGQHLRLNRTERAKVSSSPQNALGSASWKEVSLD
jgi:putative transposase